MLGRNLRTLSMGLVFACALLAGNAPAVQAQVKASNAYGDSALSSQYSDAVLQKFIEWTAHLASVQQSYANEPKFNNLGGKYHPGAPQEIIDKKNQDHQDQQYQEMAMYLESNGTNVPAYQKMRAQISGDRALKKRTKDLARDMGIKNLDVDTDRFKDAPPLTGT